MTKKLAQNKILFPDILWSLPQNVHKNQRGSVLIIAGSPGMAGAGVLAAEAAFKIGAGLVTLAHPDSLIDVYASMLPETMTLPLPSNRAGSLSHDAAKKVLENIERYDTVAIGPGLSKNSETLGVVSELLHAIKKPKVVDASALAVFESMPEFLDEFTILTPHAGEFMAIIKGLRKLNPDSFKKFQNPNQIDADKERVAEEFVTHYPQSILVLKGQHTVIANGMKQSIITNKTGNPGMAKAGTGDVLTGIVAGLVSQNAEKLFESAAAGVYLHGLAGDLATAEAGERSITASDVIKKLPEAIKVSESKL